MLLKGKLSALKIFITVLKTIHHKKKPACVGFSAFFYKA